MNVYKAIAAVQEELAHVGISKSSKNQQQGFMFRGIDAVYNTLSPLLAKHQLCILPRCLERVCEERQNAKGTALFYVTVKAEFDFVSAADGSKHTVATYGEAMDSGDKATNKAMSAAYKYAAFQAFCIPTEETSTDADAETHEVRPTRQAQPAAQPATRATAKPAATKAAPAPTLTDEAIDDVILAMVESATLDELKSVFGAAYPKASAPQQTKLKAAYDEIKTNLTEGAAA